MKSLIKHLSAAIFFAMMLLPISGCGSMAMDRLLDVANKGIASAEKNDELLIEALRNQIQDNIKQINEGADRDVDLVASGQLKHSDGTPVTLDADWVKEMRTGYFMVLENRYQQLQQLDDAQNRIKGNFKTVRALIERSQEINTGYLNNFRGITNMLDQANSDTANNSGESTQ